jgi:hypothetical protein
MIRILILLLLLGVIIAICWYKDKIFIDEPIELIVLNNELENNSVQKDKIEKKLDEMEYIDEESSVDQVFDYVEKDDDDEITFGSLNSKKSNDINKNDTYSNFTLSDLD